LVTHEHQVPQDTISNVRVAEGVYFRREDYASFWRRLGAALVDVTVAGLLWLLSYVALWTIPPSQAWFPECATIAGVLTLFGYFVVLKRSQFRTVGYRLARVALVGLDGLPVTWGTLLVRATFVSFGPFIWFLDLVWLADDRHRQALRDKVAHTYVIKAGAEPAGKGRIVYSHWEICQYNLLVREVAEAEAARSAQVLP
jgi:uncharacterized RDD family membrane protein YckC